MEKGKSSEPNPHFRFPAVCLPFLVHSYRSAIELAWPGVGVAFFWQGRSVFLSRNEEIEFLFIFG